MVDTAGKPGRREGVTRKLLSFRTARDTRTIHVALAVARITQACGPQSPALDFGDARRPLVIGVSYSARPGQRHREADLHVGGCVPRRGRRDACAAPTSRSHEALFLSSCDAIRPCLTQLYRWR